MFYDRRHRGVTYRYLMSINLFNRQTFQLHVSINIFSLNKEDDDFLRQRQMHKFVEDVVFLEAEECATFITILTRAWTVVSCVQQQCDVCLSIQSLSTRPWLFEIDNICLPFDLRLCNMCLFHAKSASLFTCLQDARNRQLRLTESPRSC